jgi:GAF domain-containing protein
MSGTSGAGYPDEEPVAFQGELARLLISEETISGLLEIVVNISLSAVPGVGGASISLVVSDGDLLQTSNASSTQIRTIDEGQYEDGDGPCIEAIRTSTEVRITMPTGRWPTFTERALAGGVTSVLSLPLKVRDQTIGALNLYSTREGPVDEAGARVARALAEQAAVVLANAAALARAELTAEHLQEALKSRDLIGQAKGILMAREGVGADEAFDLLRRASQRTGRKLRDIAMDIATNQGGEPSGRG